MAADRKVRVFTFSTGKLYRVYDETLAVQSEMQQAGTAFIKLEAMDFGRRLAVERELDKSDIRTTANAVFDESGNFILYATLLGVKGTAPLARTRRRSLLTVGRFFLRQL